MPTCGASKGSERCSFEWHIDTPISLEFFMKKLVNRPTMATMWNRPHGARSQTLDMKSGRTMISTPGTKTGTMATMTATRTTMEITMNGLDLGTNLDSMKKVLQNKLMEIPLNLQPLMRPFTKAKESPEPPQWAWAALHVGANGTTPTAVLNSQSKGKNKGFGKSKGYSKGCGRPFRKGFGPGKGFGNKGKSYSKKGCRKRGFWFEELPHGFQDYYGGSYLMKFKDAPKNDLSNAQSSMASQSVIKLDSPQKEELLTGKKVRFEDKSQAAETQDFELS